MSPSRPYLNEEAEALASVLAALDDLALLPQGWNGYGAAPINPAIVAAAKRVAEGLAFPVTNVPQVVPMTGGRLQLEWHRGPKSLELEFETEHDIRYLKWDPAQQVEAEGTIDVRSLGEIRELLTWFIAG